MDVLLNPEKVRPTGESIIGEMIKQYVVNHLIMLKMSLLSRLCRFWQQAIKDLAQSSQQRFIMAFNAYCLSVVQEAGDRSSNHIRDVESYFKIRRDNIAVKPMFVLLELDLDLPDEVMEHPDIEGLTSYAVDMIILSNVSVQH